MSNLAALPRHDVQTTLPSGIRHGVENNGTRYIEMDAGTLKWVTHTVTFPQGDTQALHISADVKTDMLHGNDTFEGVGPAVYAYNRNGSSQELNVIWQRSPETEGNADNWIGQQLSDYTRVIFIVQFPDNIRPEYVNVHWVARGYSGQVRIANFAVRDFYKRTYPAPLPSDTLGLSAFVYAYQTGWIYSDYERGISIGQNIYTLFLESFSVNIASGTPIRLTTDAHFNDFRVSNNGGSVQAAHGVAIKISRGPDIEWIRMFASGLLTDAADQQFTLSNTIQRVTQRPITAISAVLWFVPQRLPTAMQMGIDGGRVTIEVDDSALSGVSA